MDRNTLVNYLCELNDLNAADKQQSYLGKFEELSEKLKCTYDHISENLFNITSLYFSDDSRGEWRFICLNFFILKLINDNLQSKDDILSVQQAKDLKKCVHNFTRVGICTKILPKLPFYVNDDDDDAVEDILVKYNILKCTTIGLSEFLNLAHIRPLILPENLKAMLVSIYQLAYCPLKKPSTGDTIMTQEIYLKVVEERELFLQLLVQLRDTVHPSIYVKETMAIMHASAPVWFKKAVAQTLTTILRSERGVENIVSTLLDGTLNDTTQTWQILEVCSKLIIGCKDLSDFEDNLCQQLISLLQLSNYKVYEQLFVHCTKSFYSVDPNRAKRLFIDPIFEFFIHFSSISYVFTEGQDISEPFNQHVRITHAMFLENSSGLPRLPLNCLKPIIYVLFRFYALVAGTTLKTVADDLKGLLTIFLNNVPDMDLLDKFIFEFGCEDVLPFRNDLMLNVDNGNIFVALSEHTVRYSCVENMDRLSELIKCKDDLRLRLFRFLLNCICDKEKYFKKASDDLLCQEERIMNEYIERSILVYSMLSELAADKSVQREIAENPVAVIDYIKSVVHSTLEHGLHKSQNVDSDEYQSTFTILMVLQNLVENSTNLAAFEVLIEPLRKIVEELCNTETRNMVENILHRLCNGRKASRIIREDRKTELDETIEELLDPLLPVRAHAIMRLTKLVEQKDSNAMERKQYILKIFQQHLKEEDSYLYLSAIGGLTAMADVFPDTVLNVLCEEYNDFSRKEKTDDSERMKLGECLMRAVKLLGDMAPKYKPLLLNTFLQGAKDEDDLIRASALSNLGEICRVLGFKLGTIITEVLVCVHAIIATDKSPQARRAAVSVLRQIFVGLETETIDFLKDDILPIYRTLKEIYSNDQDEIMRLQAQLALEELNENVKKFIFPNPQLSDKKIFVLK